MQQPFGWLVSLLVVLLLMGCQLGHVLPSSNNDQLHHNPQDSKLSSMSKISYVMGSRMVYLTEHLFTTGKSFRLDLVVDMTLDHDSIDQDQSVTIDPLEWNSTIQSRTMLHVVACDHDAMTFLDTFENPRVPHELPSYCALPNGTIGDICPLSFPLTQVEFGFAKDRIKYHVNQTIHHTLQPFSNNESDSKYLMFFLDACETIGGKNGVLRSCLKEPTSLLATTTAPQPPGTTSSTSCFHCSILDEEPLGATVATSAAGGDQCFDPPFFKSVPLRVSYRMSFDDAGSGDWTSSSSQATTEEMPPIFTKDVMLGGVYLCFALIWFACLLLWLGQFRATAMRSHRIVLQKRMQIIPMAEVVYTFMMSLASFKWSAMNNYLQSAVVCMICVSRLLSLGVLVEVLLLVSRGWQITRATLRQWEYGVCQVLSMTYAFCLVVVQYNLDEGMLISLLWATCWVLLGGTMAYESRKNMQLLSSQLGMARQLGVNPQTTPAATKLVLFGRIFLLFTSFLMLSPLVLVFRWHFRNLGVLVEESFSVVFGALFGFTFRCREFHHSFALLEMGSPPSQLPRSLSWFRANTLPRRNSTVSTSQIAPEIAATTATTTGGTAQGHEPAVKPDKPRNQSNSMVVIVHPDQEAVLGKIFVSPRPNQKRLSKRFKKSKKCQQTITRPSIPPRR